jgi:hypothetical protein
MKQHELETKTKRTRDSNNNNDNNAPVFALSASYMYLERKVQSLSTTLNRSMVAALSGIIGDKSVVSIE